MTDRPVNLYSSGPGDRDRPRTRRGDRGARRSRVGRRSHRSDRFGVHPVADVPRCVGEPRGCRGRTRTQIRRLPDRLPPGLDKLRASGGVAAGMSAGNTRPTGAFFVRSPACRPPLRSSASRPRMSAVRSSCGNSTRSGRRRDLRGRSRSRWRCKHSDGSSQGLHRGRREDIA